MNGRDEARADYATDDFTRQQIADKYGPPNDPPPYGSGCAMSAPVKWAALECLPAKPGRWCVAEISWPVDVSGTSSHSVPITYVTGWGLDRETAEQIAAEHNALLRVVEILNCFGAKDGEPIFTRRAIREALRQVGIK